MKGYKVFLPDWTSKHGNIKFKVGETHKEENIKLCERGFHFSKKLIDTFNYYKFDPNNKVAEIEATGEIIEGVDKCVTSEIKIMRELKWDEVLKLVNLGDGNTGKSNTGNRNSGNRNSGNGNSGDENSGDENSGDENSGNRNSGNRNSGNGNSGDWNSGDENSGDFNSGNWNSGDENSGNRNSGNRNSGNRNSGNWNSGDENSGNRNSGNRNSGDWNSGDFNLSNGNNGFFNTKAHTVKIFDVNSGLTQEQARRTDWYEICSRLMIVEWVKDDFVAEGKYVAISYKKAWGNLWKILTKEEKETIKNIPNFNTNKFEKITGIKVKEEK